MDTQKLLNKYNNREPLSALESIVIISKSREAAAELASLRERAEKAEAERDALKEERNKIAKHIRVTLDDGTAPSNLVDHVLLLMLQEYDPMVKRIQRLEAELRKAQGDE